MPMLQIKGFSGIVPVTGDRALPDNFAALSINTWLYGQELRGIRPPTNVIACQTATRRVLRIPKRTVGGDPAYPTVIPPPSYLGDSVWVQFTDPDTDIIKGQLVQDQYERYYWCSPTTGPMFNTYARMRDGLTPYRLGVPGPNTVIAADGSNPDKPVIDSITVVSEAPELGELIHEIEFKIAAAGAATSYANAGGTGNRTATITITGTALFTSGGVGAITNASKLINGVVAETDLFFTNLKQPDKTIVFDFATAKVIDEVRWKQATDKTYGTYDWQASTDNVNWSNVGPAITLGGDDVVVYARSNSTAYRYYRLKEWPRIDVPNLTRAYTYTWVNQYGEESSPALPVTGAGDGTGTWNISNIKDPPAPASDQPTWLKKYLYRTITGASGQTTYYRVTEIPLGTTTYADDTSKITDAILAGNLTLESANWAPPPVTLKGWIAMPNGFLIGFDGNNVYMSEAYRFHAWPTDYKYATETPVVGLGVLGQTCVVCTQGYPATVTGSKPATCSFTKATTGEPCMSRGSIVSTPSGVIYASQNGLQMVGPGGINNITQQLITKEEWSKQYSPAYLRAVRYQNGYLALRMPPLPSPRSAFFLDATELRVALTELSDFGNIVALNNDFWSGEVFILQAGQIMLWDPPTEDLMPTQWKSKEFQFQYQENFGAYSIYWDDSRYSNYNWGTSIMPTTEKVRFKVYADRRVVYDQVVPKNGRPVRLPSGFKADIWQFEIKSRAPVYSLHVSSTVKELRNV
jgi:hypothetical protein